MRKKYSISMCIDFQLEIPDYVEESCIDIYAEMLTKEQFDESFLNLTIDNTVVTKDEEDDEG